jgi:hypothetical protein
MARIVARNIVAQIRGGAMSRFPLPLRDHPLGLDGTPSAPD